MGTTGELTSSEVKLLRVREGERRFVESSSIWDSAPEEEAPGEPSGHYGPSQRKQRGGNGNLDRNEADDKVAEEDPERISELRFGYVHYKLLSNSLTKGDITASDLIARVSVSMYGSCRGTSRSASTGGTRERRSDPRTRGAVECYSRQGISSGRFLTLLCAPGVATEGATLRGLCQTCLHRSKKVI